MEWRYLLDVSEINDKSVEKYEGKKKYSATGDVYYNKIVNFEKVDYENKPSRANRKVLSGELLFAKMKGTTKVLKITNEIADEYIFSTGFTTLKNKKGLNKDYLYYILISDYFQNEKDKYCSGATQKAINNTNLKKVKIPVPPMEIQEKIVQVLDQAQALIDKRKEQIEALDQLIESIFYTMFGDPVRNEKGWEVKKLEDLAMINPRKSEVSDIKESDTYVSFVPMKDVGEDGVLNLKEKRKLNDVYSGYTYFKENDVLFAKITPCMENGKSCIAKGLINKIGFGSTEFHVIRGSTVLTKEYIYHLVRSQKFKEEAESKMTGSAGQKRVPREFLERYSIGIPPLSLQDEFAQKVETIEKQKQLLSESLKLLEENYKSIMDKAFKGQLFN